MPIRMFSVCPRPTFTLSFSRMKVPLFELRSSRQHCPSSTDSRTCSLLRYGESIVLEPCYLGFRPISRSEASLSYSSSLIVALCCFEQERVSLVAEIFSMANINSPAKKVEPSCIVTFCASFSHDPDVLLRSAKVKQSSEQPIWACLRLMEGSASRMSLEECLPMSISWSGLTQICFFSWMRVTLSFQAFFQTGMPSISRYRAQSGSLQCTQLSIFLRVIVEFMPIPRRLQSVTVFRVIFFQRNIWTSYWQPISYSQAEISLWPQCSGREGALLSSSSNYIQIKLLKAY